MAETPATRSVEMRPPHELQIALHRTHGALAITLTGRLDGPLSAADQERVLSALQPGDCVTLDFSQAEAISGDALRRLLLFTRYVRGIGGAVTVRGLSPHQASIAAATGFSDLFNRPTTPALATNPRAPRARTDIYPTHTVAGFGVRPGVPMPLGATAHSHGVNFAVYSRHATGCTLVLYESAAPAPFAEIPFPAEFRIGDVFAMMVFDLNPEEFEYGFRVEGPWDPRHGHRFDRNRVLLDPAARAISWRSAWGRRNGDVGAPRARMVAEDFDWEGDRPLQLPLEELVIYELHVRGFTRHPSSGARFPGVYAGLRETIPYLQELGVNCVELLPVCEFDETEVERANPATGERLLNYWGYSTLGFYAPKAAYAASGAYRLQADEFKTLVKSLHRAGIEIILDVVFNHTSEGNENGPTLSFRGLDNATYYMLTPDGRYQNFSGCGNTFNCNHPAVRDYVLNCLRYWVAEYHIDGFRFDLASILGRAADGSPLANPPLLEALALDPVLGRTKLIAEAWDAGGMYQVGRFPAYGRWAEWNGKFRDCARKFLKSDAGQAPEMAQRIAGSPDLYAHRGPAASVNFITCHDGFTLADLVSYNYKHNEANGERGRDGSDENHSWNCGVEGPTDDPAVAALRLRQMKNALAMLFLSQGVPMLLMGDEMARTQRGNNNAYCQDNEISWLDWRLQTAQAELRRFCRRLIAFRQAHRCLRAPHFAASPAAPDSPLQITWHGVRPEQPDWSEGSRVLAFEKRLYDAQGNDVVYAALNMYWEPLAFLLPPPPAGAAWRLFANTAAPPPADVADANDPGKLADPQQVVLGGRSIVVLYAG